MTTRVLVLGGSGVVGSAILEQLATRADVDFDVVGRRRRPGVTIPADVLDPTTQSRVVGRYDVVVNLVASTRWTMDEHEARRANIDTSEAAAELAGGAHLVHVSTSFLGARDWGETGVPADFRNAYEWSKAEAESVVLDAADAPSIVRIPQMIGGRPDGSIERYEGVYAVARSIAAGLLPVAVGARDAVLDLCPVDAAAALIVEVAVGDRDQRVILSTGPGGVTLEVFVAMVVDAVNRNRAAAGLELLPSPPVVPRERWDRLYWPLVEEHLGALELRAIELLMEFAAYTDGYHGAVPTHLVGDPRGAIDIALSRWAADSANRLRRPFRKWVAR